MSESIVACGNCVYWSDGHCRRNAPTVITLFAVSGLSTRDAPVYESKPWSGWPLAREQDWCGEFKFDDLKGGT